MNPKFDSIKPIDLVYFAIMLNDFHDQEVIPEKMLNDDDETELRNAIRRIFGLEEKPTRWVDPKTETGIKPEWIQSIPDRPSSLAVSSDGETLAVGMKVKEVLILNTNDGSLRGKIPIKKGLATLAFHPKNSMLQVMHQDGHFEVWQVAPLELLGTDWRGPDY